MTTPAGPRRAAFAFIFVTVLLDMLALGMVIPVLPALVLEFEGGDTAHAARIVGIFGTVWALMQFVASPVVGALSDRFGRRPIILASNFGLGFDYLLMALAPNLSWLFVGRVISGITAASISTSHAYIADLLPPERRSHAFGLLGAAFGLGFVLGPALGGVLGNVDPRLPFWVAAGLSLTNAMYGIFILPESLPPERRVRFDWRAANPLGSLRLLRSHRELLGLAAVNFLGNTAHYVLPSTMVLYAMYRYGWDQQQVGFVMAAIGACAIVVQAGLVRPVVTAIGERRTALAALLFGAAGFAAYGLAPNPMWYLLAVPLQALWGLYGPAASTLMTQRVDATEQGKLQGATQSLNGIAGMIAPTMFATVFAWFIGSGAPWHVPGAPFLLAGLLLLAASALLWRTTSEVQAR